MQGVPVFLGGGIALYFWWPSEPPLWAACLACLAAWVAAACCWRQARSRVATSCLAAAASGFLAATLATWRAPAWEGLPRIACSVQGRVALVEALPAGVRLTLESPSLDGGDTLHRSLRIRLKRGDTPALWPGAVVRVRALVRPPPPPDYPGGWDTQREAFFAGLAGYGYALGPVEIVQAARAGGWAALRDHVLARVMGGLPPPRGAIAAAMLTGIGTAIAPEDRAAFQASGLSHLLAVAGLHVGIVMGLVFGAIRFGLACWERAALHWPVRQIASLAALAAACFYLALTGAHVPILRSVAMACLVTLGVLTGRRVVSLRGLGVAACVLLLAAPHELVGVSFQMSFSAVLALIAGYRALRPAMIRLCAASFWWRPALHAAQLALTSLLAGTASLPFAIYHFGRATLWYVPANLIAVPLTAFWVMPWGVASLALMPLGLERLALAPMGWGIAGLLAIGNTVAAWPAASLPVPQMPGWGLCLVALGLVALSLDWFQAGRPGARAGTRLAGLVVLCLGVASPLLIRPPDVVVAPDASMIAWRDGGRVLSAQTARASAFERAAPERVFGAAAIASDCNTPLCPLAPGAALVRDTAGLECGAYRLLVSAAPLQEFCPGTPRIDRFSVWRNGATDAWLSPAGATLITDRDVRGRRPWVIGRGSFLPPARTE